MHVLIITASPQTAQSMWPTLTNLDVHSDSHGDCMEGSVTILPLPQKGWRHTKV